MGRLQQKLDAGERVLTAEITPPKGAGIKKFLANAAIVGPCVDAINVTDCQRALVKMSSLAAARVLLDNGYEPVYQLTCRDRNTIALQADLMGAGALGIPNVLCLTGDPVKVGDSPESKSVFEVESVRLLEILQKLQAGRDNGGNKMNAPTKLYVGCVVNPTVGSLGGQLERLKKKLAAGARFVQTQANYDTEDFARFLEAAAPLGARILAGILVLHTKEIAHYIHDNIPGIRLPAELLAGFDAAADAEAFGIEFAARQMVRLEGLAAGFHLMTVREESLIPRVLEKYHAIRSASKDTAPPLPSAARS